MEQNTTKILLEQTQFNIPPDTIGIDIGQSLAKISYLKITKLSLK